jgi:aldehyde dehydrogenase (NAD+)
VILDDADIAQAVPFAVRAGLFNNGQSCVAGTRILIPQSREEELTRALADAVAAVRVGDPRDAGTVVGPVLDRVQYDRVQGYIRSGIAEGGTLLAGGLGHPDGFGPGNYVKPTLLATANDRTVAREEVFGPVLSLITYRDEDEAVAIANDTSYGLQAYIATGDAARGERVARRLQAGRIMINEIVGSRDAPFGGFKWSGIGREFSSWGISAYLEDQVIFR